MMEGKIKRLYLNPKFRGSFTGFETFNKALKNKYDKEKVLNTLKTIPAYTQNRPAIHKFKRRKVIAYAVDEQFVIDLIDISKYSRQNRGCHFLLVVIDVLSKYLWIEGLKNKRADTTLDGFKKIIEKSGRIPKQIQCDKGNEFKGVFKSFCTSKGIKIFHVESELKACTVERVNRTILERIHRYLLHAQSNKKNKRTPYRFIHVLPNIVSNYNNTVHSSTGKKPSEVNEHNAIEVWMKLYGKEKLTTDKPPKFNVGHKVLISIDKKAFVKGYAKKFHPEVFIIDRISNSNPRMYYLKDQDGEKLEGGFYFQELSHVLYN